jgi:acetone carboxylase gamma subunit
MTEPRVYVEPEEIVQACHTCGTASGPLPRRWGIAAKALTVAGWRQNYFYYPDPDHPERAWLRDKRWLCPACLEKKWTAGKPE